MKLSSETNKIIEDFFRQYFNDENLKLPAIEIYAKRGAWLLTTVLNIHGITIGRHIFIKPDLIRANADGRLYLSKNLLVHEATHVLQYQKQGFFGFLYNYFKEYFNTLRRRKKWNYGARMQAYLDISHEVEARDSASEFTNWLYLKGNL